MNAIEKRLEVLDEHIKQAEYYRDFKSFNDKYKQMKPKHQEAYFEAQRRELTLFGAAQKYFTPIMKGKTNLPLKEWKDERAKLTAEKKSLYKEYHSLKDEVREVEIIRRNVDDIMCEDDGRQQPQRRQELEI